jgi:putative endonuclease
MYYTYILYSDVTHRYYTGQCQDLENRLSEHNAGETPSIKKGIPWKVVWYSQYATRSEAMKMEKMIKSRGAARFLSDNKITITVSRGA